MPDVMCVEILMEGHVPWASHGSVRGSAASVEYLVHAWSSEAGYARCWWSTTMQCVMMRMKTVEALDGKWWDPLFVPPLREGPTNQWCEWCHRDLGI